MEIRKLTNITKEEEEKLLNWFYSWWGQKEGYPKEAVRAYIKNSLNDNRLPQSFGLYEKEKLIGIYQISLSDLFVRPNIYPWLINLYIDEAYRNKGYGRVLIESVKDSARALGFSEIFLYTSHQGLYEKYSWFFVEEIETFLEDHVQRLYRLDL